MKKMLLGIAFSILALSSYGQAKVENKIQIQLIRNATVVLNYAGKKFLMDPMLAKKGAYPGFEGTANSHLHNPLVELPVPVKSLLNPDAIIVSHTHLDHWDEAAVKMLSKNKTIYAQNEDDAKLIKSQGFTDVRILSEDSSYENIKLQRVSGQHGSDEAYAHPQLAEILGEASGVYITQAGQKSIYFAGDTIWTKDFELQLKKMNPEIIVLNTGDAQLNGFGAMIMGKDDVYKIYQLLPNALIIAIHMEAINHCILSRKELKDFVKEKGLSDRVLIPSDGELINL